MKQKTLTLILSFCLVCAAVFAQKNKIELYTGSNKMYDVVNYYRGMPSIYGIGVSRNIRSRLAVEMRYFVPNIYLNSAMRMDNMDRRLCTEERIDSYSDTGKLIERRKYHYFDAGLSYRVFSKSRHSVSVSQYLTMAFGKNDYLTSVIGLEPLSDVVFTEYETKKEIYAGGVSSVSYDYHLWKNRINLGLDVAARYYTGGFPFQLNYGLHLGYNF